MGQKCSSAFKQLFRRRKLSLERHDERTSRRPTVEQFLRQQGYLHEGEFLEFIQTQHCGSIDERSRFINDLCHQNEYISHRENVRICTKIP